MEFEAAHKLAHSFDEALGAPAEFSAASIVGLFGRPDRPHPDAPFVSAIGTSGEETQLSYGQLDSMSARLAVWAQNEIDARPGTVVALLPQNDIPSVLLVFGLLRSGCTVAVLSPTDPPARVGEQLASIGCGTVVGPQSEAFESHRNVSTVTAPSPSELPPAVTGTTPAVRASDDALMFCTSGSTASSKIVVQTHGNVVANANALRIHHGLTEETRVLGCLPICHVNGMHFTLFASFASGAHCILLEQFDPFRYSGIVERFRPNIASVVPSILDALLTTWREPQVPAGLNYFVSAASPLSSSTCRSVWREFGVRVLQGYGLTETTNFSTTVPRGLPRLVYSQLMLEAEIPSIGVPVWGNDVAVLRADGSEAAEGEEGEICVRGLNVMDRYAHNHLETARAFADGWFHTQDLGFSERLAGLPDSFLFVTGRIKNIAKVGGLAVSLEEMERVLIQASSVVDAACVAFPHRISGEEVVAAISVIDESGRENALGALKAAFAEPLIPRRIEVLETIPRTATGKLRRGELGSILQARDSSEDML